MSEPAADFGRSCHCISATLATMGANAACARFMMDAPGGSVVRSVLALIEASQDWSDVDRLALHLLCVCASVQLL